MTKSINLELAVSDLLFSLPGYALRRAANAMMAELAKRLALIDLHISDASVLMLVAGRDDMTSSDIGRLLDIQRANMVPLLDRLSAAELIDRLPINRKSLAVVLTERGRAKLAEVMEVTMNFERELLDRIPPEHRDHLVPALNALWH
jgi:DNA-binding MarR family transcriptional regulator